MEAAPVPVGSPVLPAGRVELEVQVEVQAVQVEGQV